MTRQRGVIGLVGCGQMGRGIARHLRAHGQALVVFDTAQAAMDEAVALGAQAAASVPALCEVADIVITCLPSLAVVDAVYRGDAGVLQRCRSGTLLVETSTTAPSMAREFNQLAHAGGLHYVDAPLVGTAVEAWNGTLAVLASGDAKAVERARPVLQRFCAKVIDAGGPGQAHVLKSLNNAVAMTNHAILCEAFAVAQELGLDLALVLEVLRSGFGASRKLEDVGPKLVARDHPRRAVMRTAVKDLSIFQSVADGTGVLTPVLEASLGSYRMACKLGAGGEPPSRLADVIRPGSGVLRELLADLAPASNNKATP